MIYMYTIVKTLVNTASEVLSEEGWENRTKKVAQLPLNKYASRLIE